MATFQRIKLSGSTDGMLIPISGSASAEAVLLHTATSSSAAGVWDAISLWAVNNTSASRSGTLEWGDSGSANEIKFGVPALQGLFYIEPGCGLQNSRTVKMYAEQNSGSAAILIKGFVDRITE
jgi:hypothetical protein